MQSLFQAVVAYVKANPTCKVHEVAKHFNISEERAAIYIMWTYYKG